MAGGSRELQFPLYIRFATNCCFMTVSSLYLNFLEEIYGVFLVWPFEAPLVRMMREGPSFMDVDMPGSHKILSTAIQT